MERYVCLVLSAVARTQLERVPREALQDVLAGTELYNQAVEEQRAQHGATQLRAAVLLRARPCTEGGALPHSNQPHPAAFSVRELTAVLAAHHAQAAARRLHSWSPVCPDRSGPVRSGSSCGSCRPRCEWSWERLQCSASLHLDHAEHPAQGRPHSSCQDPDQQCQNHIPGAVQTGVEPAACHQERCSAELLFQLLVSCPDLLLPLGSHPDAPDLQPQPPHAKTHVSPAVRGSEPLAGADSVLLNKRLSTDLNQNQNMKGAQADWAELDLITRLETTCR